VRENCTPGSVRGAPRKGRSYRDGLRWDHGDEQTHMSDTPTDSTACAKAQAVRAICEHLAQMFTQDPVQTIWEGHLQYEVAMLL